MRGQVDADMPPRAKTFAPSAPPPNRCRYTQSGRSYATIVEAEEGISLEPAGLDAQQQRRSILVQRRTYDVFSCYDARPTYSVT
jgi:hypothetical protein